MIFDKKATLDLKLLVLLLSSFYQTALTKTHNLEYHSPGSGSRYISNETTLCIRYNDYRFINRDYVNSIFDVHGEKSGRHNGIIKISDDKKTLIFEPDKVFEPGEDVTVRVPSFISSFSGPSEKKECYTFTISSMQPAIKKTAAMAQGNEKMDAATVLISGTKASEAPLIMNGVSVPSDFPLVDIKVKNNPSPGNIFLTTWGDVPYVLMLDNYGAPLYYKRMLQRPYDFKLHPSRVISYHQREYIYAHVIMDSTFTVIGTVRCGNGYVTDDHELHVLPDGHYLLIAMDCQRIDMSEVVDGGDPNALVCGNHVQELDADKNVVFEWRCWDHYKLTDANHEDLCASHIDFTHMNAVDVDFDGHLLISSRNLSEITKINRINGKIMWRFGGVNNEFELSDEKDAFNYQHCIRALPNGNYMLFDNGNYRSPKFSRAVEYHLDTRAGTARIVWEYRHHPDYFSMSFGNAQRLENGNTLINWGKYGTPKLVEVRPDGEKAFELDFVEQAETYRTYRFPWHGKAAVPYLIAENHCDRIRLIYNKFGDFEVQKYIIYGGTRPRPTEQIATSEKPYIDLAGLQNNCRYYFRVATLDWRGNKSDYSNEVYVDTHFWSIGENILMNGDFSQDKKYWQLQTENDASAVGRMSSGREYHVEINKGGQAIPDVKLVQQNIKLIRGKKYALTLAAFAERDKLISIHLRKKYEPWTDYSQIGYCSVTRKHKLFTYQFEMTYKTDYHATLEIECGGANDDIYFSQIILKEIVDTAADNNVSEKISHCHMKNYPNPFNPVTNIQYTLPDAGFVHLAIYNVLGEKIETLVSDYKDKGDHNVEWDASKYANGVYFYQLSTDSRTLRKRMLLMK